MINNRVPVTAVLIRDIFGYLFGGIVAIIGILLLLGGGGTIAQGIEGWPEGTILSITVVAAGYPAGRLVFRFGKLVHRCLPFMRFDDIYDEKVKEFGKSGYDVDGISIAGVGPKDQSAHIFFGHTAPKWILLKNPDLFYADVTRKNTLRILSETTTGLVLVLGGVAILGGVWMWEWVTGIWTIALILSVRTAYLMRHQHAEAAIRDVLLLHEKGSA